MLSHHLIGSVHALSGPALELLSLYSAVLLF